MAESYRSTLALLLGARDRLRNKLNLDEHHCEVQPDGKPPAFSGQVYVAVHPGELTLVPPDAEAWLASVGICVTVTMKAGKLPADRFGTDLVALVSDSAAPAAMAITQLSEKVAKFLHLSYTALENALAYLEPNTQGFTEPLRMQSLGRPAAKGPDWFGSEQRQAVAAGWAQEIRFYAMRPEGLPGASED